MSGCMVSGVHRTNIYLSEVEVRALDARAAVEGRTRSEIVRRIIDRELNLEAEEAELDELLLELAGEAAALARRLSAEDPDLSVR